MEDGSQDGSQTLKSLGRWITALLIVTHFAYGNLDRRLWVIEQLGHPPLPPVIEEMRNQVGINTVNYGDTVSTQVSGLINLSWFEIGVKASTRFYTLLSDEGRSLKDNTSNSRNTIFLELARSYVSQHGHYGRFSVGYVEFMPVRWRLLRIAANTGILSTPDSSLYLRVNVALFFILRGALEDNTLNSVSAEIGSRSGLENGHEWRYGGTLNWSYRSRTIQDTAANLGRIEDMLFSLGPFAEYTTGALTTRAFLNARLWLDKEVYEGTLPSDPNQRAILSRSPNVITYPDVGLVLTLVL